MCRVKGVASGTGIFSNLELGKSLLNSFYSLRSEVYCLADS